MKNKNTCADEHNIVLPVLCFHSVYHQLRKLVVHICPHHDGASPYWMHWVVHGRVTPCKGNDIIRKVLSGVKPTKCLARALRFGQERTNVRM